MLILRSYTINRTLFNTKLVKIIYLRKFVLIILDADNNIFVVHMAM